MQNRLLNSVLITGLTCVLTTASVAQSLPEKFIVNGKAADKIQDHNTINLETARQIAETCEALVVAREPQRPVEKDKDGNPIYSVQINGEAPQQTVMILEIGRAHV